MTKDNILFGVVGLLAGLIIGFFIANSINQGAMMQPSQAMQQTGALPAGHPEVSGNSAMGGSVPEVQAAIDRAKQNPSDFDAQVKAAELFYQIQRYDGAIEYLKKANQIRPDDYEVMVGLANASFDGGKYEEAEKWYESALERKPDDLNVRTDLGLTFVFREKPDLDRAITEFKKVLARDPNHQQALQNLTVAYTKKGDLTNAKSTFENLSKVAPSNDALLELSKEIQKLENK